MKKIKWPTTLLALLLFSVLAAAAEACSVVRVIAKDGTIISARTMEFGMDMKYNAMVVPRGKVFASPAPGKGTGLKWKTRYGYVAVNALGDETVATDGMNEAGLSMSHLWYENDMEWQTAGSSEKAEALANAMFGTWILGNFATVDEAAKALKKIKVFSYKVAEAGNVSFPAHFIINDAKGGSIVIEYDKGQLHVYDNPLGIMTNAPNFPWMVNNLRNYVGMTNDQRGAQDFGGMKLPATGHGAGMLGLPGDITPPSRFVRLAVLSKFADPQETAEGALNLAQHLVSTIHIVKGTIVDRDKDGKIVASETTQWSSYRDLTNRIFYFRTYDNFNMRKIDLKRLDFTGPKVRQIEIVQDREAIADVTDRLK